MSERDAVIVDAVRTPVGKRNGSLASIHAVDLSAHVLNALVARNGFDPAAVDDVIWGCVRQAGQMAPVELPDGQVLSADEGLRRGTSPEKLAGLKAVFKEGGVIHAGNSSQISDGAAAVLMMTSDKARKLGLTPLARVRTAVLAGDDPVIMLTAPIPATLRALKKSGLSIGDIGAFEVNEAFAPVPLAWLAETGADPDRLNTDGGAIAICP